MGRHRSPQSNSGVAKELVFAVIAVLVVIALLVTWFLVRRWNDSEKQNVAVCPAGEISLPYALLGGATELIDLQQQYLDSKPAIQDYCVTSFTATPADQAALVYTAASNEETLSKLADGATVNPPEDWPTVGYQEIGIAVPEQSAANKVSDWQQAKDVAFVSEQALAAAIANQHIKKDPLKLESQTDVTAAKRAFVTAKAPLPQGYSFVIPSQPQALQVPVRAVALHTSSQVTEEQARAAAEFSRFATSKAGQNATLSGPAAEAVTKALQAPAVTQAATPTATAAPAPAPAAQAANTLLLLDTSATMQPLLGTVSAELAQRATQLGGKGLSVGLWNYSSPLNPGVVRGWRPNVSLGDSSQGANAAAALQGFGTGGVPQTHAAVANALLAAQEYATTSGKPAKVVLVTTGTSDAGSLGALDQALQGIDSSKVSLHVVHVAAGGHDEALFAWATAHGGSAEVATDAAARGVALNKALGL